MPNKNRILGCSVLMAAAVMALSCGADPDERLGMASQVKITNGADTADFPAVVELDSEGLFVSSLCTGTFVSKTTLITAAHCDAQGAINYIKEYGFFRNKRVKPMKVILHPDWKASKDVDRKGISATDIAVIIYPPDTAPAVARLAENEAEVDDVVTIVGFGANNATKGGSGFGTKRMGLNTIERMGSGFIEIEGENTSPDGSGRNAGIGGGDSGGPLFIDDALAGTTIGSEEFDESNAHTRARFTNLHDPRIRKFLKDAVKDGADIPGL